MYKEGKNITEIAETRNLSQSTIEGHLAHYVSLGIISVNELVKSEKLILIEPHLNDTEEVLLSPLKSKLGNAVSFGEIRFALAAKEWERSKNGVEESGGVVVPVYNEEDHAEIDPE